uniref:Uncharacterized protein n=1 Tax=Arundo donax TaxID=35708 RepID=A0A0A9GFA6_ARUDO
MRIIMQMWPMILGNRGILLTWIPLSMNNHMVSRITLLKVMSLLGSRQAQE